MKYTTVICSGCTTTFSKPNKYLKDSKQHFCTMSCYNIYRKSDKIVTSKPYTPRIYFPISTNWPVELQSRVHNRKKIWCIEYKGGRCKVCNYCRHPSALEFHHVDPTAKLFEIGESNNTITKEDLATELDKCELLCANCHREVHAGILDLTMEGTATG